jgi:hypothetical protein
MVAFSSSRRQQPKSFAPKQTTLEGLAACGGGEPASRGIDAHASRRNGGGVEVARSRDGGITQVKIGRWRTLAAGPQRRLSEVRELACERVAVKIDRFADGGDRPSSEIWQLYDREGRLEAAMQSTPDGRFALLTNYQTREACRLVRNQRNELETVERWRI